MSFTEFFDWTEHSLGESGRVCTRCGCTLLEGGRPMKPGVVWQSREGGPRITRKDRPSDPDDRITLCAFQGDA